MTDTITFQNNDFPPESPCIYNDSVHASQGANYTSVLTICYYYTWKKINVYCKSHTAYINTLGGPNEQCLALYLAVHILTTGRS